MLVFHRAADEFAAHGVQFRRRSFDLLLDFVKRESIIGALVLIAFAGIGVEGETHAGRGGLPVVALVAENPLHQPPPEKCDPNEPKPLRATLLEDLLAMPLLLEALLLVKFVRDDDELLLLLPPQ